MISGEKAFLEYTSRFDTSEGRIRLKILHTMEVVKVMDRLTAMKNLSEKIRRLAEATALFHDIGRFEQVTQYGTFSDERSVNHGLLGCRVLKEEGLLDFLPEEEQEMVLTAIGNHNKYVIDEGLPEETELLCKLIRDADKIDIFRVFATEELVDTMGETREQVAGEKISDEVYERIMAHGPVPKSIRKTGVDYWVGFLGFLYDLYFEESREIIREHRYYRMQFDRTEFLLPETRERVRRILKEIDGQ